MSVDHIEDEAPPEGMSGGRIWQHLLSGVRGLPHRLWARRPRLRIPIFTKLAALSTLLILLVISAISFTMLSMQKRQFTSQLMDLGESMAHVAASNAPDKLLGEEELSLFQLVKDLAENDQVLYAVIVDNENIIKAHSTIEQVNKPYFPPSNTIFLKESNGVNVSSFSRDGEDILFFENAITYQKLAVGDVFLAISQRKIKESIRNATVSILLLTLMMIIVGVYLSLRMSKYFSAPIKKLQEGAELFGMGYFDHQVALKRNDELGDLGSAFDKMAKDLELKKTIEDSFGRYVTPEIVDLILANPDDQWMKGSAQEATVLFVDIRGFTALSEDKEPERIVELLNRYFTLVTDVVIRNGGHLNKFVGDEAMVIFGAPVPNPQHAKVAVRTALDIQDEIANSYSTDAEKDAAIKVGIGINSGVMVAGNLGSAKRMEYTVIGDDVNVASGLTSLAEPGEILISKRTLELISSERKDIEIERKGKVSVKGRKMKIDVFSVLGMERD